MKIQEDEPSIRIVLIALIITAITIAVFCLPTPKVEAPQDAGILPAISEADAAEVDEDTKPIPKLRSELVRVCSCESTGRPDNEPLHYDENGDVLLGKINPQDTGLCQINLTYHEEAAERMGYDLFTEEGNIQYANWLYDNQGLVPWRYSKHCWQ